MEYIMAFLLATAETKKPDPTTYKSKCISCHNKDPRKPGSVGPDLYGSSLELITLKTQERKYPEGYKPKRKTKAMPKIKLSDQQLKELHEYINSFEKEKK